ncbi:TIR domain-containing protein [Rhodoblastus acidophilus]|uniref:TIR domain-containing protein n=1 Tax=Rhodoblastus acidophilus TaxID=1074 RepID=A0A6N8DMQ3_RHOAC|nr:toll/interleukin-1 receptor domain-containing protein [Rhodoblastus acidophilus]MCW2275297.1 hypothetical protein [Rhodoblastus acidophilus]MTV31810.1 TIR domain-containing protein [Rhodoblastus acidophilus]
MGYIVICFSEEDRTLMADLQRVLETRQIPVWTYLNNEIGIRISPEIAGKIRAATAVIVLWTPTSVNSNWVQSEAQYALDNHVALLPVCSVNPKDLKIEPPFNTLVATNLSNWNGEDNDPCIAPLYDIIGSLFSKSRTSINFNSLKLFRKWYLLAKSSEIAQARELIAKRRVCFLFGENALVDTFEEAIFNEQLDQKAQSLIIPSRVDFKDDVLDYIYKYIQDNQACLGTVSGQHVLNSVLAAIAWSSLRAIESATNQSLKPSTLMEFAASYFYSELKVASKIRLATELSHAKDFALFMFAYIERKISDIQKKTRPHHILLLPMTQLGSRFASDYVCAPGQQDHFATSVPESIASAFADIVALNMKQGSISYLIKTSGLRDVSRIVYIALNATIVPPPLTRNDIDSLFGQLTQQKCDEAALNDVFEFTGGASEFVVQLLDYMQRAPGPIATRNNIQEAIKMLSTDLRNMTSIKTDGEADPILAYREFLSLSAKPVDYQEFDGYADTRSRSWNGSLERLINCGLLTLSPPDSENTLPPLRFYPTVYINKKSIAAKSVVRAMKQPAAGE